MPLHNTAIQMKFFKNQEMNKFYWSIFIMTFGERLINIFVPIYFYNLGFKIPEILSFYFLVSLIFIAFSYLGAKITSKIGEKLSILISTPFVIIFYLGLTLVNTHNWLFYILAIFLAFRMIFFNYGFHLNFLKYSNQKNRGKELALFEMIKLVATMLAPFIGGVIANINFNALFVVSSFLIFIGSVPLFLSSNKYQKIEFSSKSLFQNTISKQNTGNLISFSSYAIESIIGRTIWPIFLIRILGSINKTGLFISISMILSLLIFNFIGKLTDQVNKIRMLKIGTVLYFFAWLGRAFADTSLKVLFIDSYKNLSEKFLYIPWSAHNYDLAKRQDYFAFIVSREIIFNFSRVLIFPFLIFLFYVDFHPFFISFLIASIFSIGYVFIDK